MDDELKREIDHLRDYFNSTMAAANTRYEMVDRAHEKALLVALEANEKRLATLNGFREAMADTQNRMVTRAEAEAAREALIEKTDTMRDTFEARLESEVKPIAQKVEAMGRPNWPLMASFLSVLLVMVTGIWIVIGLKIDSTIAPVTLVVDQVKVQTATNSEKISQLETLASNSTQADVQSKTDRGQLNERMRTLENQVQTDGGTARTQASVTEARLVEVESQFCSSDHLRNLMHATDLRILSMLWAKVFTGEHYPTDNAYYPVVCNRKVGGSQ